MKTTNTHPVTSPLLVAFLLSFCPLQAQINPKVEVQRDYEGRVLESTKPKLPFTVPDSIAKFNLTMDYAIFDKPYYDLYSFTPLPSVHLSVFENLKQPWAFIRIGMAPLASPEADIFLQAPLSGKSALLLTARHQSFWGKLPRYQHSGTTVADQMQNSADVRYLLHWSKGRFEIGGAYDYNRYNYYGVSPDYSGYLESNKLSSRRFMRDSMSHAYHRYKADISLSSLENVQEGAFWRIHFGWSRIEDQPRFWVRTNIPAIKENLFFATLDAGTRFLTHHAAGLLVTGELSDMAGNPFNRAVFSLNPYYRLHIPRFHLTAGIHFSYLRAEPVVCGDSPSPFQLSPKLSADYELIPQNLWVYGDISGGARLNSYHSIVAENPWLTCFPNLQSTMEPWNIQAGIKGKMATHFSYHLYGQYVKTKNQYYFTNTSFYLPAPYTQTYLLNLFDLRYEDGERMTAAAELGLDSKPFIFNLTGKYNDYRLKSGAPPKYAPRFEFNFSARYQWRERIIAAATVGYKSSVLGHYFAPSLATAAVIIPDQFPKINGYTDIGLTFEYRFASWFGFYGQIKNLLNVEKQYYLFYLEPGIRIGGGVTFRF